MGKSIDRIIKATRKWLEENHATPVPYTPLSYSEIQKLTQDQLVLLLRPEASSTGTLQSPLRSAGNRFKSMTAAKEKKVGASVTKVYRAEKDTDGGMVLRKIILNGQENDNKKLWPEVISSESETTDTPTAMVVPEQVRVIVSEKDDSSSGIFLMKWTKPTSSAEVRPYPSPV
eukprot:g20285.t1